MSNKADMLNLISRIIEEKNEDLMQIVEVVDGYIVYCTGYGSYKFDLNQEFIANGKDNIKKFEDLGF